MSVNRKRGSRGRGRSTIFPDRWEGGIAKPFPEPGLRAAARAFAEARDRLAALHNRTEAEDVRLAVHSLKAADHRCAVCGEECPRGLAAVRQQDGSYRPVCVG